MVGITNRFFKTYFSKPRDQLLNFSILQRLYSKFLKALPKTLNYQLLEKSLWERCISCVVYLLSRYKLLEFPIRLSNFEYSKTKKRYFYNSREAQDNWIQGWLFRQLWLNNLSFAQKHHNWDCLISSMQQRYHSSRQLLVHFEFHNSSTTTKRKKKANRWQHHALSFNTLTSNSFLEKTAIHVERHKSTTILVLPLIQIKKITVQKGTPASPNSSQGENNAKSPLQTGLHHQKLQVL